MYPPIHQRPGEVFSFDRLDMLWERYPQYHEMKTFSTMESLLNEHESWTKDFEDVREEYYEREGDRFLIQLSWADLPYRHATGELLRKKGSFPENEFVKAFMDQFRDMDTDREAYFLIPESYLSQFIVVMEVCKRARELRPVRNLFPDEEIVHYLAVFDKENMDDVLLMFHLDTFGGYSLYEYPLIWYQTHLLEEGVVLRSPYLPDRLARYMGGIPYCYDPVKTVYVRRSIDHILESCYFGSELEFFWNLTQVIMPLFQWWYTDLALYEEKDGFRTDWRLERTKIRTRLTAEGVIKPKWKHELSLFHAVRELYPDVLYQYRPDWLGRQSLDMYIPSLRTAIEYQGIQHYLPVDFFGGEEALAQRQDLDAVKKQLCGENEVRLIEWPYSLEPTAKNVREVLG